MTAQAKRKKRRRGIALTVLAGGFLLSAALRTGDVVAALPGLPEDGFGNALPTAEKPGTGPGDSELRLIAELRERQKMVAEREAALAEREQVLEEIERRLRQRLEDLAAAQRTLESTAALVDDAAGKDIRHLATMYQQMKPKQAGAIFNQMAPSFAAGFLGEMAPEAAALIMANMEANKAYGVSLLLAGRNVGRAADAGNVQPSLKPTP